jgi:hypothetical protein
MPANDPRRSIVVESGRIGDLRYLLCADCNLAPPSLRVGGLELDPS